MRMGRPGGRRAEAGTVGQVTRRTSVGRSEVVPPPVADTSIFFGLDGVRRQEGREAVG